MSQKTNSEAKAGKPIEQLTPFHELAAPRKLGMLKGQVKVNGDLKDPIPADMAAAFGLTE